jgi:hypothetical protein
MQKRKHLHKSKISRCLWKEKKEKTKVIKILSIHSLLPAFDKHLI